MLISEFDFHLPNALIAQEPLARRSGSRLLHLTSRGLADRQFADLPDLLRDGDLLVVNDSRVLPARLFGTKSTGGKVEILVERVTAEHQATAMIRASKSPGAGSVIALDENNRAGSATNAPVQVTVNGRSNEFFDLTFSAPVQQVLLDQGQMPLPPYINRPPQTADDERYQTVYAKDLGSVAAPTAGLHFDASLIEALSRRAIELARVTLHVGAGTFSPVRVDELADHQMHFERYEISDRVADAIARTRQAGGRVIAVGTTSLRTLEGAAAKLGTGELHATSGETDLFITPGYQFQVVDALITNFHLPRSTLLVLVSAFAGMEPIRAAYQHAVAHDYRFFSYGDAMFIDLAPPGRS
ncbi:MAG: tRNA preQ1(34) S-adenosylmethionine ribosyltransferase-isomerase QueA [Burkholderiaceae bacterium]